MKHPAIVLALLLIAATPACSSGTIRGDIERKVSDTEAEIDLGEEKVQVGDRLTIYENECAYPSHARRAVMGGWCDSKVKKGEATVVQVLDRDSAIIRVDPGVKFRKDMDVEKKRRMEG